jgi:hypothetical protein
LKFGDAPTQWFPVSATAAGRLRTALPRVDRADAWVTFQSLANKFIAVRPAAIRKVWLLSDASDPPDDDWTLSLPYRGMPLEHYRGFEQLHDLPISPRTWEIAAAQAPKRGPAGDLKSGDPAAWEDYIQRLSRALGAASGAHLAVVAEAYAERRLFGILGGRRRSQSLRRRSGRGKDVVRSAI